MDVLAKSGGVAISPPPALRLLSLLLSPLLSPLLTPLLLLLRSRATLACGCSISMRSSGVTMSGASSHIVLHRRLDLRTEARRGGSISARCSPAD